MPVNGKKLLSAEKQMGTALFLKTFSIIKTIPPAEFIQPYYNTNLPNIQYAFIFLIQNLCVNVKKQKWII